MPIPSSIHKLSDTVWELPTSYKPGMRVPARIYATEKLLQEMDDGVIDQVTNVAMLPGLVKASMCMPDGHWGYGFCIGGVAAMDPDNGGVISPGGIGFDINCLTGDARILHQDGYTFPIQDFGIRPVTPVIRCFAEGERRQDTATIRRFLVQDGRRDVFLLRTATGRQIKATADHPFLTPTGMRTVKDLGVGDNVAVIPFEGCPYEPATERVIVTCHDIDRVLCRFGYPPSTWRSKCVLRALQTRGLLPLAENHPRLPALLKIMGMMFGDASMNFIGARQDGVLYFCGREEDLNEIRKDIAAIGYTPGPVHWKVTRLEYRGHVRTYRNAYFLVNASSLMVLLAALGVPVGRKVSQPYGIPQWLWRAPQWQRRLFLASLFGAELTTVRSRSLRRGNFCAPALSMNKEEALLQNGITFLEEIGKLAQKFGAKVSAIQVRRLHISKSGRRTRYLELVFSPTPSSLQSLWGRIGFLYHREKAASAAVAVHYLSLKQRVLEMRRTAAVHIQQLNRHGETYSQVHKSVGSPFVNLRYVKSVIQRGLRTVEPRIPASFPSFEEFQQLVTIGVEGSGVAWDAIESIEPVKGPQRVYDFTVAHPDHNFVANGFVVSNCGMRLVVTNLTYDDVKPHLKPLVDQLFQRVPAGVGSSGFLKLSHKEFREVIEHGARWCVKRGLGWEEDLQRTEEGGCITGAKADKISQKAIERGVDQIGTLGSGNHYLEIQVAKPEHVFDKAMAEAFGITIPNQVVVMYHCGSRGFGHQVATDYLQVFLRAMPTYRINVPDRELACAPFRSSEGQDYFSAMKCGLNMSFANRQVILHRIREVFSSVFGRDPKDLGMHQVYDVAHNTAKLEDHLVDGALRTLLVHRKGSTRAFGPKMAGLPPVYHDTGQPVIIGGSMETGSYLLAGVASGRDAFFSTAHGSGRTMSRTKAKKLYNGRQLQQQMEQRGIYVRSVSYAGLAEEAGGAYKDIDEVVEATELAGISKRVARLTPIGNVKG